MKSVFVVLPALCLVALAGAALAYRYPEHVPPAALQTLDRAVAAVRSVSGGADAGPRSLSAEAGAGQGSGAAGRTEAGASRSGEGRAVAARASGGPQSGASAPGGPPGRAAAGGPGPGRGPARPAAIEAAPVRVDRVTINISAVGTLVANEQVTIAPEIAGRVSQIILEEGRPVAAGDPLVSLDQTVLNAELASAQSALKLAQTNFQRADILARQNTGTQRARDEAVAALEGARAALDLAQARLEKATIRAPFAGILGLRAVSVGEFVSPGDTMLTLQSIDPLKVDFRIPETFLSNVRPGQTISLTLDALPGERFAGEIYAIDPQVDVNGRALKLRALVKNESGTLRPGLFARVDIAATTRDRAILVPESAVVPLGQERFVFVVRDGKAARVQVSTGQRQLGDVEITEGLSEGDIVVTSGQQRLRDGMNVDVVNVAAETRRS